MENGDTMQGAVSGDAADRYRFYVGDVRGKTEIVIEVSTYMGSPIVYAACEPNSFPRPRHHDFHDWALRFQKQQMLVVNTSSHGFRPGWIYVSIFEKWKATAAYSLRVHWGDATPLLADGFEVTDVVPHSAEKVFQIAPVPLLSTRVPGARLGVRAEALKGHIRLSLNLQVIGSIRHSRHELGVEALALRNISESVALAALDLPAWVASEVFACNIEDDAFGKCHVSIRVHVHGLAPLSAFTLRVVIIEPVTLSGRDIMLDALAPPCCMGAANSQLMPSKIAPEEVGLLQRRYWHFLAPGTVRSAVGVAVELRDLGGKDLVGTVLTLQRRPDEAEAVTSVRMNVSTHAASGVARMMLEATWAELTDGTILSGGMWLEAVVEARRPLNFSLQFGTPRDFVTPALPTTSVVPPSASPPSLPPPTRPDPSSSPPENGTGCPQLALLPPGPAAAVLKPPAAALSSEGFLSHCEDTSLCPGLRFAFPAVALNRSVLPSEVREHAKLEYILVAVPQEKSWLNARTACGLAAAIEDPHGAVVHVLAPVKKQQNVTAANVNATVEGGSGRELLEAVLPAAAVNGTTQGVWINVLATLVNSEGRRLAATCYIPFDLNASATYRLIADARSTAQMPRPPPGTAGETHGSVMVFVVVGVIGLVACKALTSESCCGSSRRTKEDCSGYRDDSIELETHYDLEDDCGPSRSSRKTGGYVPPTM
jgi:hypothetical protein